MSIRVRAGKLRTPIVTVTGALAFVLLSAAPAAASAGHEASGSDGFTPPFASVRITGDDVENRDYSVRITGADNRDFSVRITSEDDSVRITKLEALGNRDF